MIVLMAATIAASLQAAPAPARVAPPAAADVACITAGISQDERAALLREITGEGQGGGAERAFDAATQECAQKGGWSGERVDRTAAFAVTSVFQEEGTARLVAAGIDPERVTRWFRAQGDELRLDLAMSEAAGERLAEALIKEGVSPQVLEANGAAIGLLYSSLVLRERLDRGLSLD